MLHQSPLLLRRDGGLALRRSLQKIVTILKIPKIATQNICRSTIRMRSTRKQRSNTGLRRRPEPLNANGF